MLVSAPDGLAGVGPLALLGVAYRLGTMLSAALSIGCCTFSNMFCSIAEPPGMLCVGGGLS